MKKRFGLISLLIGIIFPILSVWTPVFFLGPGTTVATGLPLVLYVCIAATTIGFIILETAVELGRGCFSLMWAGG